MRLSLCCYFAAAGLLAAEPPPLLWENHAAISPADLAPALAKLDAAAANAPVELGPAVAFQRILMRIRAGAPVAEWREAVGKFLSAPEKTPVAEGLRELARGYEARARMGEIDAALRLYYRNHVQFPATFAEVEKTLPENLQKDPWGDAWSYAPKAPKNFSAKFAAQRYTLEPGKHPTVRPLAETVAAPNPARGWKISGRQVGGQRVLEIKTAGGQTTATQAGGKVEDATVLHIGEGWALCADLERLFTIVW